MRVFSVQISNVSLGKFREKGCSFFCFFFAFFGFAQDVKNAERCCKKHHENQRIFRDPGDQIHFLSFLDGLMGSKFHRFMSFLLKLGEPEISVRVLSFRNMPPDAKSQPF